MKIIGIDIEDIVFAILAGVIPTVFGANVFMWQFWVIVLVLIIGGRAFEEYC